ncbi:hypothetical protein D1AOALGA4SA_12800 [Olavius algarvensis Delta 1 endosymbiont]|nr:hypothetical protein D1AOALGA4SA_12800 [Olavius algarvensis Delta 1 endosymbiont]
MSISDCGILIILIDRAQRFHQSEIRNPKSQIIILDVIGTIG